MTASTNLDKANLPSHEKCDSNVSIQWNFCLIVNKIKCGELQTLDKIKFLLFFNWLK